MSALVAVMPAPSFRVMSPSCSSSSSARASLVVSLGTAIWAPSARSAMEAVLPA